MKLRAMDDHDIANLLREAARKIKAGEPLLFGESSHGGQYVEGPAVVALLLGIADGKTLGQVLKKGRPKDRINVETYVLVERARKRLGSYSAAYTELAQVWRGDGVRPLRGEDLAKAAANVKKAHQRARAGMKPTLDKIEESRREGKERAERRKAMAGKTLDELLKGT